MQLSVRPAVQDDIPLLVEIEKRIQVAPWDKSHFEAELSKPYSQSLVLTDDETDSIIAGYIVFWTLGEACEILNLGVDLAHRGVGHAKTLMRKMLSTLQEQPLSEIRLEVRKSNDPAIQLYQGLGFSITHIRKDFYTQHPEDAYVMVLALQPLKALDGI